MTTQEFELVHTLSMCSYIINITSYLLHTTIYNNITNSTNNYNTKY